MIEGQLIIYRYNGLVQSRDGADRNLYTLKDIKAVTVEGFREQIEMALDEVPPGKGYALVKWNGRMFLCEKDVNKPEVDYVRHEVKFHPLQSVFTK
jgi:hypothetical protein